MDERLLDDVYTLVEKQTNRDEILKKLGVTLKKYDVKEWPKEPEETHIEPIRVYKRQPEIYNMVVVHCPRCNEDKDLSEFVLCRSKGYEEGTHKYCMMCEDKFYAEGKLWCVKCGELKSIDQFHNKAGTKYSHAGHCKQCEHKGYIDNDGKENIKQAQRKRKHMFVEMLGGQCQHCDYKEHDSALCFHHINPEEKEKALYYTTSIDVAKKELDKCAVLCLNCHATYHSGEWLAEFIKVGYGWRIREGTVVEIEDGV